MVKIKLNKTVTPNYFETLRIETKKIQIPMSTEILQILNIIYQKSSRFFYKINKKDIVKNSFLPIELFQTAFSSIQGILVLEKLF